MVEDYMTKTELAAVRGRMIADALDLENEAADCWAEANRLREEAPQEGASGFEAS